MPNPLSMSAGCAALKAHDQEAIARLNRMGDAIRASLSEQFKKKSFPLKSPEWVLFSECTNDTDRRLPKLFSVAFAEASYRANSSCRGRARISPDAKLFRSAFNSHERRRYPRSGNGNCGSSKGGQSAVAVGIMEPHRALEIDDCLQRLRLAGYVVFGSIRRTTAIQSRFSPMSAAARADDLTRRVGARQCGRSRALRTDRCSEALRLATLLTSESISILQRAHRLPSPLDIRI